MLTKKNIFACILSLFLITSCADTIDRLKRVGKSPALDKLDIPENLEDPMEIQKKTEEYQIRKKKTNSLWQPGSTSFFRDSRAWKVGDIVRVIVNVADNATLTNTSAQSRSGSDSINIPSVFGKELSISKFISPKGQTTPFLDANNSRNHTGSGNINRREAVKTTIAAIVTDILQNGNLVIQGKQEIKLNYEIREIKVAGIIRPKDISAENSINSDQIAEARISYGGRGNVSDMQSPRVGSQIVDIISPF